MSESLSTHPPLPVGGFSSAQLAELATSRFAMRRISRAISMAQFDGWTIGICGGLTLLLGLTSLAGILLGIGLLYVAFIELRAGKKLRQLDPLAAQTLGTNQLLLAGMLILYALWWLIFPAKVAPEILSASADLKKMGIDIEQWQSSIDHLVYLGVIVVAVLAQGSMALFYFRRVRMVRDYLQQTPAWIVQLQRAGLSA